MSLMSAEPNVTSEQLNLIDISFDETGFKPALYSARPNDVLRFLNTSTTSDSLTVYVLSRDGAMISEWLLGPSNGQFQVGRLPVAKVVQHAGKYLLALAPPSQNIPGTDCSLNKLADIIIT